LELQRLEQLQQLERLEQLQQLERLQRLQQLERLQRLQQLERLQRLQQLERLQRLEQLDVTAKDYTEVIIPKEAVVYCDPPYSNTAEYKEGNFDSNKFWEWCRKISKTNPVYVSEYKAPDDFKAILIFSRRSTLQGGNQKHTNQPDEKLFVYNGNV
jgi:site-specific DNA-adenine methylase